MKKIALWKITLLLVVTAGLYSLFWFARNRNYLVTKKSESIPKWPWLLAIPVVYGLGCIVGFAHLMNAVFGNVDVDSAIHSYMMALFMGVVVAGGIYVSWLWLFSDAMEKRTQGRVSRPIALALGIFTGPFLIVFYQYYINRLGKNKQGEYYKVSSGLLIVAGIIVALGILSTISTVANLTASNAVIKDEITKARDGFSNIQKRSDEYTSCNTKLSADFTEVTDENRESYDAAEAKCKALYDEYQGALDTYIKGNR